MKNFIDDVILIIAISAIITIALTEVYRTISKLIRSLHDEHAALRANIEGLKNSIDGLVYENSVMRQILNDTLTREQFNEVMSLFGATETNVAMISKMAIGVDNVGADISFIKRTLNQMSNIIDSEKAALARTQSAAIATEEAVVNAKATIDGTASNVKVLVDQYYTKKATASEAAKKAAATRKAKKDASVAELAGYYPQGLSTSTSDLT